MFKHRKIQRLTVLFSILIINANTVFASPPKVIALAPHIVEMLYSIGAGDQIIGTSEYSDYPAAALKIPRVGNYAYIQIEQILTLDPDLIIAWPDGNSSEDLTRLRQLGFNVVTSEPKQLIDVAKELRMLGQLTGHRQQASIVASNYEIELNRIISKYYNKRPISVFYELWSQPLTTVAGTAWPQQQLTICGAQNPFADSQGDYPQVGLEQIVLAAPEVIIQPTSKGQVRDPYDWLLWPEIPAVARRLIIHPDADQLHRMSTRMLKELSLLCEQVDNARQHYPN